VVWRRYRLEEPPRGLRDLAGRQAIGKAVLVLRE
jgi:hypothetical protein